MSKVISFLAYFALMAFMAYFAQRYRQYVWPWGVLAWAILLLVLGIWTFIDYRQKHRRPPTL